MARYPRGADLPAKWICEAMTGAQEEILTAFRNPRYDSLNALRWAHFLSMEIPIAGKTIFEPGAGIGDQTQWLLDQGAKHIYVNDGHDENLDIIRERFGALDGNGLLCSSDSRLTFLNGNLESCLGAPEFSFYADLIFCYGVYYHLNETYPNFHIMRHLAPLGEMIVFDYLTGDDTTASYGYDNPSTALSRFGCRPRVDTLMLALKSIWGHAYEPKEQLKWVDPVQTENRLVAVASHFALDNPNLMEY